MAAPGLFRSRTTTFAKGVVAILTLGASSLALAQAVPTIGAVEAAEGDKAPWRGSSVSYGHSATALTFAPAADPFYNPTWGQRIGLMPEWHFTEQFHLRSRFFLSQEFTLSDSTRYRNEIELSDVWLDAVFAGWKEPRTGIRVAGDVRVLLPTSKPSIAQTRLFTLGPSLNVSRNFKVLAGLSLSYSARFTYRFNRLQTFQNAGPSIENCGARGAEDCAVLTSDGLRAIQYDFLHGATATILLHPRVIISNSFLLQRGWLPPLAAAPSELADAQGLQVPSTNVRDFWAYSLSFTWQTWDSVGFTLGAFTFSPQLGPDSRFIFPLFNRNTVVSLDVTVDVEAAVSRITHKEKS